VGSSSKQWISSSTCTGSSSRKIALEQQLQFLSL
jgi:hypothetical protein